MATIYRRFGFFIAITFSFVCVNLHYHRSGFRDPIITLVVAAFFLVIALHAAYKHANAYCVRWAPETESLFGSARIRRGIITEVIPMFLFGGALFIFTDFATDPEVVDSVRIGTSAGSIALILFADMMYKKRKLEKGVRV